MSRNVTIINESNTFEEWFNKTNLLIDAVNSTVTIGPDETNAGDVIITGNLSAQDVAFNSIQIEDPDNVDKIAINDTIEVSSADGYPVLIHSENDVTSLPPQGVKIGYSFLDLSSNKVIGWEIGPANNPSVFQIKNSVGQYSLDLVQNEDSTSATLVGTNVKISDSMLPDEISSSITGASATAGKWVAARTVTFDTGDVTGSFSIDGSANINNVVLTVADNSHKHAVSNIDGLQDILDNKQSSSGVLNSMIDLVTSRTYGLLAHNDDGVVSAVSIDQGTGILVENGQGVGGNPKISHADTSQVESVDNSNEPSKYIKSISVDGFGHISSISSGDVPLGKQFTSGERAVGSGQGETLQHGLGATPSLLYAYLLCKSAEHGFGIGETLPIECLTSGSSVPVIVSANATNVYYRFNTALNLTSLHRTTGQVVNLTESKWRLVVTAGV